MNPDRLRLLLIKAREVTCDIAWDMARSDDDYRTAAIMACARKAGVRADETDLFSVLVASHGQMVRRVLRDTGAEWLGQPAAHAGADVVFHARDWRDWGFSSLI